MTRTPLIAGNWKMNKTQADARAFLGAVTARPGVDVAVCAPYTSLAAAKEAAHGIGVFAQNMHEADKGAFTGEISAPMLLEIGVDGVVLGHSERRQLFGETDRALSQKVPAALGAGLVPILCVGETEEEREAGDTQRKLRHQVQEGVERVGDERLADVVIAYEPIWAIGTGRVATVEQADDALSFCRALVGDRSKEAAERVRILYGGSMSPDNAADLLALSDCDGGLIGGASLEPASFQAIIDLA